MITAKIVADSVNEDIRQSRITSFVLTYPRFIHSELMTHRMFSRNAASCLAGDTEIYIEKPSALNKNKRSLSNKIKIKDLYKKWTNGDNSNRSMRNRLKLLNLRCLNEDTGVFSSTKLINCVYSGEKDVYEIELENGYKIQCTKEHRIFTDEGWKTLNDINIKHSNNITSYDEHNFKISTNGLNLDVDFIISERDNHNKSLKTIAEENNISYKSLSYFCDKHKIRFKKIILENENLIYKDRTWLEAKINEGLYFTQIAKLCNSTTDRVKKTAKRLNLRGNAWTWGNIPVWNKGKRYSLPESSLTKVREAANKRIENNSYLSYKDEKTKMTRWLNEIRSTVLNKFDYKCALSGSHLKLELHHIDPRWNNKEKEYDIDNIIPLNKEIHRFIHSNNLDLLFLDWYKSGKDLNDFIEEHSDLKLKCIDINKPKSKGNFLVCKFFKIKNVKYVGVESTYDIEVEGPYHNFVANGIVVHNSRAIPINKFIEDVLTDPALPIHWGANQKGMQADNEVDEATKIKAMQIWHEAKEDAVKHAKRMNEIGIHKQIANRLMEPFFHITTLVTATEYSNFFKLRAHSAAQPEIRELAYKMQDALASSIPDRKTEGQWHIPFGDKFVDGLSVEQKLKVATARAARVSYKTFEGEINYDKDYTLHDQLLAEGHYSPFEHCAQAETGVHANFSQWKPYRIIVSSKK